MREIKFRAFDIKSKKMFFVSELRWRITGEFLGAGDTWFAECELAPAEKWSLDIMQYTNLHDKNGKEIYEGDIVKCFYPSKETSFNQVVKFDEDVDTDGVTNHCAGWSLPYGEIEVIGNIYENPELLEK